MVDTQQSAVAYRTADNPLEHIASAFIAGHNHVSDHEDSRTNMVSDDTDGNIRLCCTVLIGDTADPAYLIENVLDRINIEDGIRSLHDAGNAFQPHAGIDVLVGKIGIGAVALIVELGEYMVPKLNIPVTFAAGLAVRLAAAVFLAAVKIDFRAGAAGAGADFPEVVFLAQTNDSLFGKTNVILPDVIGLIIIQIDGSPKPVDRQIQHFGQKFPAPGQRLLLEIVAERKVAHHFEKGTVTCCVADILQIRRTDAFLACGHAGCGRCLLPGEKWLQRRHTRIDDEQALIMIRNQRIAVRPIVTFGLIKAEKAFSNLIES